MESSSSSRIDGDLDLSMAAQKTEAPQRKRSQEPKGAESRIGRLPGFTLHPPVEAGRPQAVPDRPVVASLEGRDSVAWVR